MDSSLDKRTYHRQHHRSFFWPVILIGAGIFLLIEQVAPDLFVISPWLVALRLWPALLILLGVDLLFGRGGFLSRLIGAGLGLLLIGVLLVVAINPGIAPGLALEGSELRATAPGEIALPGEGVEVVNALIVAHAPVLTIEPRTDSENVFAADVSYYGALDFGSDLNGGAANVRLVAAPPREHRWFDFGWVDEQMAREAWSIFIAPDVVYNLNLEAGDADMTLNLAETHVRQLGVRMQDGSVTAVLPPDLRDAIFFIDDGALDLTLPDVDYLGVRVNLLEIDSEGTFEVGPDLVRTSGSETNGIWETEGFESAEYQINMEITADKGSVIIH